MGRPVIGMQLSEGLQEFGGVAISMGVSNTAVPWQQAVETPTFQQGSTVWQM